MQTRWHDLVLTLALSANASLVGCATPARQLVPDDTEILSLTARHDASILAVDRTDHAKDWIGEYKGRGDFFNGQFWERQRATRVFFNYGRRTADGRRTISMGGFTNRIDAHEGHFAIHDIELGESSEVKGVFGGFPADKGLRRNRERLEYTFSLNDDGIEGHVKQYWAEGEDGPFVPRKQWVFELKKNRVDRGLVGFPQ